MAVHGNRAGLTWHLLQGLGHLYLENHSVCTCHYIKHNNNIKTISKLAWRYFETNGIFYHFCFPVYGRTWQEMQE